MIGSNRSRCDRSAPPRLPGALAELLRDAPLSPGKVTFAWKAAVGPALERVTAVRLEGTARSRRRRERQWAQEVDALVAVILRRLQTLLGAGTSRRIDERRSHA